MRRNSISVSSLLPQGILIGLLLYLLWWRWTVGMTRFFDVDEFSYLHWAANFAKGERPYADFFMFFTPGFLWAFAPLAVLFSFSTKMFIAARVVSLGIFVGILVLLGLLFFLTRSRRWALVPVIILAFLPMPYDKYLEIRPDNLATLLAMGGLVMEVFALLKEKTNTWLWAAAGALYASSLAVFAKTLPFALVGVGVAFLAAWWGRDMPFTSWWSSWKGKTREKGFPAFLLGFGTPLVLMGVWIAGLGDLPAAWYSLTKLPFEANMIGKLGIMEPHLFFFPNGSFYGGSATITASLLTNHALWTIGIVVGVVRLFTPFLTADGNRKKVLTEVLVASTFILSVLGYVQFFPLKHSQYLIPIGIFIAYYSADALLYLVRWVGREMGLVGILILLILGSYGASRIATETNTIKLSWNNATQIAQTDLLLSSVPPGAEVLDLEGRMVFWDDAYYICCVPFGSFVPFLSRKPPVLRDVLETKKTPYIFQGDSNRLGLLSHEDQTYIRTAYEPVPGWGEGFWARKGL